LPTPIQGIGSAAPVWANDPEPGLKLDDLGPTIELRDLLLPSAPGRETLGIRGALVLMGALDPSEEDARILVGDHPLGPKVHVPAADVLRSLRIAETRGGLIPSAELGILGHVEQGWTFERRLRGVVFSDPVRSVGLPAPWRDPIGPSALTRPLASWDDAASSDCAARRAPPASASFGIDTERGLRIRDAWLCAAAMSTPTARFLDLDPLHPPGSRQALLVRLGDVSEARIDAAGRLRSLDLQASAIERWNRSTLSRAAFGLGGEPGVPLYLPSRRVRPASGWGLEADDALLPLARSGIPAESALR